MTRMNQPEIVASGITRTYQEGSRRHTVLDNIDLQIQRGESVAVRGRSGSGKSTLLNLLGAIDSPDSGTLVTCGVELTDLDEHARTLFRREKLGFVYQAFNLIPTLTVADNIRLVLELNAIVRSDADARIEELLGAVGLEDRAASFPDILSGGEQQRVAIARALAHRPRILIADEPTGNLDDTAAENVLELLEQLVRAQGGTMVIATHSTRVAAACDRSIELHNGRLERVE
ncbi:MAG: ABC transporter ATP-binding protein [Pseudomonadota bacterium]